MVSTRARSLLAALDPREQPVERLAAAGIALLAGIVVYGIATGLFPHHSANHDEAVYLEQAAMFLDGRLDLQGGSIADAVRPWFFVDDGGRLYPKYQPYPAALFAIPMGLFGTPRLALAFVAIANTALVYVLGAQAFDRRVGVVAAAAYASAPMTVLTTSVFLPYAPTTMLTLAFATLYLRAYRQRSTLLGALAGVAIGLAFVARPYTAVLFAAPFIVHACWQLLGSLGGLRAVTDRKRLRRWKALPEPIQRNLATAAIGLAFVGLALAYNAVVTGDPLQFPYAAFAPEDGPGFGHREITGHSLEYTPELAARANGHVLWALFTRWGPAGPIGTALALVGIGFAVRRWRRRSRDADANRRTVAPVAQALLVSLFVSVAAGNLAFWGNYNVLGDFQDPTDGLLGLFGPFYHYDLLVPLSIFAAAGLLGAWRWVAEWDGRIGPVGRVADGPSPRSLRAVGFAAVLLVAALGGAASASLVQGPADRHAEHTEYYETAYEPFEDRHFDDAVVFTPTPYGDWLNHPFQSLRNGGDLDGDAVYALDRHTASDFAVLERYPDRTPYRYNYRGEWTPGGEPVIPRLQRLERRTGERLTGETVVGVPDRVSHASVRLETDPGRYQRYEIVNPNGSITVPWSLNAGGARLEAANASESAAGAGNANGTATGAGNATDTTAAGNASALDRLLIDEHEVVVLQVRLAATDGSTLTYRQEVDVQRSGTEVTALWPPERTVCTLVDDCGLEGTYLPDRPEEHVAGVAFETRLRED